MQVAYRVAPLTRSPKIRPLFGPPIGELPDARDRDVLARRQKAFGRLLLRPDPLGDVELHSAAECFIAQMRICDLRVRVVRDGHEPNEAEEQRPCCVPIDPVHVISSPKARREQEGYQNSGSFGENGWGDLAGVNPLSFAREAIVAKHGHALPYRMAVTAGLAFCQHHRRAFSILRHRSRWRNVGYPLQQQITLCEDIGHHLV